MCKHAEKRCKVVNHNHYYEGQQANENCNTIEHGKLQRFRGEKSKDPCEWEVGDVGQGFRNGVFGLYLLKEIHEDGSKTWETVRQSKDATL